MLGSTWAAAAQCPQSRWPTSPAAFKRDSVLRSLWGCCLLHVAKRPPGPLAPANGETLLATSMLLSAVCSHLTAIPLNGSSVCQGWILR